jgi:phage terminase large subunit-like protein
LFDAGFSALYATVHAPLRCGASRSSRAMGCAAFAAQYQQSPVPPGGKMIDWNWFRWYRPNDQRKFDRIVISWDTATKASELSDYSVGTVRGDCGFYCLLDVVRERLEYPALKRKVIDTYNHWCFRSRIRASARPSLPNSSNRTCPLRHGASWRQRMAAQSAKIEAGVVCLPMEVKWLKDFRTEVLAFSAWGA